MFKTLSLLTLFHTRGSGWWVGAGTPMFRRPNPQSRIRIEVGQIRIQLPATLRETVPCRGLEYSRLPLLLLAQPRNTVEQKTRTRCLYFC
jgi:hypothetical protein